MNKPELYELLRKTALELTEHCDSVQIVATTYDTDGNWYARQGSCRAFIERDQASDAATLIAKEIKALDDD